MTEAPTSFEEHFKASLKQEMEVLERPILNGSCKSFEEYRWYTGQLQGLRLAEAKFAEMVDLLKGQD